MLEMEPASPSKSHAPSLKGTSLLSFCCCFLVFPFLDYTWQVLRDHFCEARGNLSGAGDQTQLGHLQGRCLNS